MMTLMAANTIAQYLLFIGYAALFILSVIVGWRLPRLRPVAVVTGSLGISHAVFYALFVLFPDVLDATATMWFSLVIRSQVLFTAAMLLALAVARRRWRT